MLDTSCLKSLGLTEKEIEVYLCLIKTGPSTSGGIIKKTGYHKATVYQIFNRLLDKGIVSNVKEKKGTMFSATDPNVFIHMIEKTKTQLDCIVPSLKYYKDVSRNQNEVTVYKGINGLKTIFESMLDELNPKGEYLDFGVSGLFKEKMGNFWYRWQKKKREYKIQARVIFNEDIAKSSPDILKEYVGEYKFHSRLYKSMTDTIIYNDKVVLIIWTSNPPIGIFIRNKENAESYKHQFEFMWKNAKKKSLYQCRG